MQTYGFDPTTGKKLTRSGFSVNAVQPMTQKEVDAQCDMVSSFLDDNLMKAKHLDALAQKCDSDAEVCVVTVDGQKAKVVEWYIGAHDKLPHLTIEMME